MKTLAIIAASLLILPVTARAQSPAARPALDRREGFVDSARTEIDAAVAAQDANRLAATVVLLDRALAAYPGDPYVLHYRGYAAYRQVIAQFMLGNPAAATPFIDRAVVDLQASSQKLQWPENYALLAALTGFRISLSPDEKATLGPQIQELSQQAMQLGLNNPRVLYMAAQSIYRTPPEYGGGVDPARSLIMRAIEAFKTDKPGPLMPAWGQAEATVFQKQIGGLEPR